MQSFFLSNRVHQRQISPHVSISAFRTVWCCEKADRSWRAYFSTTNVTTSFQMAFLHLGRCYCAIHVAPENIFAFFMHEDRVGTQAIIWPLLFTTHHFTLANAIGDQKVTAIPNIVVKLIKDLTLIIFLSSYFQSAPTIDYLFY